METVQLREFAGASVSPLKPGPSRLYIAFLGLRLAVSKFDNLTVPKLDPVQHEVIKGLVECAVDLVGVLHASIHYPVLVEDLEPMRGLAMGHYGALAKAGK